MTRRYDDPVDVRRHDDVPTEFLWRGRLYVVRDVLAHWIETGAWWRVAAARAASSGATAHDLGDRAPAMAGTGGPDEAASASVCAGEREMWRVEASAGRARGTGVFDLAFDWTAGIWTLARALD